jgi:N-methylhydantoinase A
VEGIVRQARRDMQGEGFAADEVLIVFQASLGSRTERVEGESSRDPVEFSQQLGAKANGTPIDSLHVSATRITPHWRQKAEAVQPHAATARSARDVWWESAAPTRTPIYDRDSLAPGATIEGPAIVEAPDTTYAVCPGWKLAVNELAFYVMTRK